jgi:hypothetical protein
MADNNQQTPRKYEPMEITVGTWHSPKSFNERTSLSLKYKRDYVIFKFMRRIGENQEVIEKKMKMSNVIQFENYISNIIQARINVAKNAGNYNNLQYIRLEKDSARLTHYFYDSDTRSFKETGDVFINTIEINGINRVALTATTSDNKTSPITVVFVNDESNRVIIKVSEFSTIDFNETYLYEFGMKLHNCIQQDFMYLCSDKNYQLGLAILLELQKITKSGNNSINSGQENTYKKPWSGNNQSTWKKPWQNKGNYNNNYQNNNRPKEFNSNQNNEADSNAFDDL